MLGWIPFTLVDCPVEEVNNPRPEWIEAKKTNAQYIAHWIDDYNTSVCKKAKNFSSAMTWERTSVSIKDIDIKPARNSWVGTMIPCRGCYTIWEKRNKETGEPNG